MNFETWEGSFSAVSTPVSAKKYLLKNFWRDLQDLHTFAHCTFGIQLKNHENRFWQASIASLQPQNS